METPLGPSLRCGDPGTWNVFVRQGQLHTTSGGTALELWRADWLSRGHTDNGLPLAHSFHVN